MSTSRTPGDREPIVIGVGQFTHRITGDVHDDLREPIDLLEEALRRAIADCGGSGDVAAAIDRMGVVQGLWSYPDPGRLPLDRVGAVNAASFVIETGGNMVQAAVIDAAEAVGRGELDVAVVSGTEAHFTRKQLRRQGENFSISGADLAPADRWGPTLQMDTEYDRNLGFDRPLRVYPLFESAIRTGAGRSVAEHEAVLGDLWSRFNAVAVANPDAWNRTPMDAEGVVTPAQGNRMVSTPYTKAMVADPRVNQAGAVIVASVAKARELGVPQDQWVFLRASASANDTMRFGERDRFDRSPALEACAAAVDAKLDRSFADLDLFDLYSCFPSMVQITAGTLGIPLERALTVTGGLSFFGGPLNSYVIHAIVTMVERLRASPDALGLVHGNGGFSTKHNLCVYGAGPAATPYGHADVNADVDHAARRLDEGFVGPAAFETSTVVHDRGVDPFGLVTMLTESGDRAMARVEDPDDVATLMGGVAPARSVSRTADGLARLG